MPRSGAKTRERIVDAAEALVYQHGFAATSIDKVIERVGITKGAFFYHFKAKADLGRALIQRYAERDLAHLERTIARTDRLSSDPRQRILIFIGLLQEDFKTLPDPIPGCLFTSYLYESTEYPEDVAEIAEQTFVKWRDRVAGKIEEASKANALVREVPSIGLASTLLALIEGGFVLAKAQRDASVLIDLLDQYRAQIEVALEIEPGAPNPPGGA
jgi:TetR/AcrR family transcriptional repressor of nem operon